MFCIGTRLFRPLYVVFFFGLGAACASLTPFGKTSGAHLNPSVSLAFSLSGRLALRDLLGYVAAQLVGGCLGAALLYGTGLLIPGWQHWMHSIHYAATLPNPHFAFLIVALAELGATAGLASLLLWLATHPRLKPAAIWAPGIYYFCANPLIAWISGDSTNFARSLGPAIVDGDFLGLWIYAIGPAIGATAAILLIRSGLFGEIKVVEARLTNFGHHGRVPRFLTPLAVGPSPKDVEKTLGNIAADLTP